MQNETKIPSSDLQHALLSMACSAKSQRILVKNPEQKKIGSEDRFTCNDSFTSKFKRIRVQGGKEFKWL